MQLPLSFAGRMRPLSYAVWSCAVFFSQHLIALAVLALQGRPVGAVIQDWYFYVMPLRELARYNGTADKTLGLALFYLLLAAWMLAALAFRRAADADVSGWNAVFAVAPIVQIPVILVLSALPSQATDRGVPVANPGTMDSAAAAQGLVAGLILTVLAVAVGALFFGSYGYGMFVVSPFIIGTTSGYCANRTQDIGAWRTAKLVVVAILLGGIALLVAALEGLLCIILAAPLAFGTALVGGQLGRAIAVHSRRPPRQVLSGLALLPLVFALENLLPVAAHFDTQSKIQINAPPEVVWKILIRTDLSDAPVSLPFRLGVAYPLRGEVIGEGAGAIRLGEFSTGTVVERVTEWILNRKLAFVMLNEVPAMRELSPYAHVHAPHVVGYFRTTDTSFELVTQAGGGTEIIERTSHELRLEPVLYWLPLARRIVQVNNDRVLAHIKRTAECNQSLRGAEKLRRWLAKAVRHTRLVMMQHNALQYNTVGRIRAL
jgi:uncharacterized membrane protein YhaH (DUF805 family)